eukprot:TRINITY_DN6179_c0_g1_i1.p1 TRINITY_DN6179_c0_g1~~TRINITY_DN6179_c0_g1_i1.p1  ORF type:complete len:584 (-),score=227.04 TRINITY_DN6179_c0_g1_i1:362-2077(-)
MKSPLFVVFVLSAFAASGQGSLFSADWFGRISGKESNPIDCVGCTLVVSIVEQLSIIHDTAIDKVLDEFCGYFPAEFQTVCVYFVNTYGDEIIKRALAGEGPDDVCHGMGFCKSFPTCRLYNGTTPPLLTQAKSFHQLRSAPRVTVFSPSKAAAAKLKMQPLGETPWQWIMNLINRFANQHEPIEDLDGDYYSVQEYFRGSHWRGKDCDDFDKHIHAGRAVSEYGPTVDHNCNGIAGIDNSTSKAWEDELCGSSSALGTIVIGDSGGAHFEIPPSWLNASEINKETYKDLLTVLENEFDLPELSGYTGFITNTTKYSHSVYQYMRQRNLCNHRDYQNCGVNGARSGAMKDLITDIARDQTLDKPVLLFYELIGNDVCAGNDLNSMTTVAEFTANVLQSLQYFEQHLPAGSHIVFVGLAPGELLWDLLNNRTHPIGVKYVEVYNYLNCLDISPCWEWMNSDPSVRAAGTQRAHELSAVYPQLIANYSSVFKNFDMAYIDFPMAEVIAAWTAQGGEAWQLIEPVDGFHPNQIAHSLMADAYWNFLLTNHSDFVGPVNPNNAQIAQLFGNQGGY